MRGKSAQRRAAYSGRSGKRQGLGPRQRQSAQGRLAYGLCVFAQQRRFWPESRRTAHEPPRPPARLTGMRMHDASSPTGETTMIRKFVLAAAAIAALGTVSLTASTTPAAAWGKGGGFHHFHGGGFRVYSGIGALRLLPAHPLGREPLRQPGAAHGQRLLLSADRRSKTESPGLAQARPGFPFDQPATVTMQPSVSHSFVVHPASDVAADHAADDWRHPEQPQATRAPPRRRKSPSQSNAPD